MKKITFEIEDDEALALAQLCKRAYTDALLPLATDREEAETMFWALTRLRVGLAEKGYSPR